MITMLAEALNQLERPTNSQDRFQGTSHREMLGRPRTALGIDDSPVTLKLFIA